MNAHTNTSVHSFGGEERRLINQSAIVDVNIWRATPGARIEGLEVSRSAFPAPGVLVRLRDRRKARRSA